MIEGWRLFDGMVSSWKRKTAMAISSAPFGLPAREISWFNGEPWICSPDLVSRFQIASLAMTTTLEKFYDLHKNNTDLYFLIKFIEFICGYNPFV